MPGSLSPFQGLACEAFGHGLHFFGSPPVAQTGPNPLALGSPKASGGTIIVRAPPPAADPGDLYFSREAGKQDRSPPIRNAIDQFNCSFIYKRRFPPIEV